MYHTCLNFFQASIIWNYNHTMNRLSRTLSVKTRVNYSYNTISTPSSLCSFISPSLLFCSIFHIIFVDISGKCELSLTHIETQYISWSWRLFDIYISHVIDNCYASSVLLYTIYGSKHLQKFYPTLIKIPGDKSYL